MKLPAILTTCALLAGRELVPGMAMEAVGPQTDCAAQPDWPKGIVEVARHPTRVYSVWCNGGEDLYFQAGPAEANELVALFCKGRFRDHEIKIEEGPRTVKSFGGDAHDYNVCLHITGGIALSMSRTKESSDTFDPQLIICVGRDHSLLKQLKLPDNAILQFNIPGADYKGKTTKPARLPWYGRIQLGDAGQEADYRLNKRITLWDNTSPDGIEVAAVSPQGWFQAVFSEAEMESLKKGESWLAVTIGNYTTQAKKNDPKFPAALLARAKDDAKAFALPGPKYYWGRILFEDESPAILDSVPWPGAEIHPDFPYVGMASIDAQGYFKVFLTPEQFENLKTRKPSRNIYIPMEQHGRSSALETFPPELLSQDKAKAGMVKIARPVFKPHYDPAKAPSLVERPLPSLKPLKLDLSPTTTSHRMMLLCFFDLQERPSRYCLSQLAKSADILNSKGVLIAGIQTSPVATTALDAFARTNRIAFPLGMIDAEEEKTKFNWGLRSQPWLILTDQDHVVRAEGFSPDDLDEKLSALR